MYTVDNNINKTSNVRTYNVTLRAFLQPFLQWQSIKYYVFYVFGFVALVIQQAMCMCHIVIVVCLTLPRLSVLSLKRHDFRTKSYRI
jgi:hypothetical protein